MHLGKYTVYLNLPLIIGVALFCLHILEGADTACNSDIKMNLINKPITLAHFQVL